MVEERVKLRLQTLMTEQTGEDVEKDSRDEEGLDDQASEELLNASEKVNEEGNGG